MDQTPDWTEAQDLRALLEAVERQEIRALSPGLGLGSVQPHRGKHRPSQRAQAATISAAAAWAAKPEAEATVPQRPEIPPPAPGLIKGTVGTRAALEPAKAVAGPVPKDAKSRALASAATPQSAPRPQRDPADLSLAKQLLAWAVDFLLVAASLSVAVFGLVAWHGAHGGDSWITQRPVQWLLKTSPWLIIALVYAVFLVYGLAFKLLVGRTCGELMLGISPRRGRP